MEKLVSQWAHNPKIAGSSPACATKIKNMLTESEAEITKIIELGKEFPNNQDLGNKFRSLYKDKKIAKSIPNDFDLGNELRKLLNQVKESEHLLEKLKNLEIRLGRLKKNQ